MTRTIAEWVEQNPDLLLGLLLIAVAFCIAIAARVGEESRRIDHVRYLTRPPEPTVDEPPVDEWAAELEGRS